MYNDDIEETLNIGNKVTILKHGILIFKREQLRYQMKINN